MATKYNNELSDSYTVPLIQQAPSAFNVSENSI